MKLSMKTGNIVGTPSEIAHYMVICNKIADKDDNNNHDSSNGAINSTPKMPNDNDLPSPWALFNWAMNHDPNIRK